MPFTARVGNADEVFTFLFVDFQIVGDVFAVRTMTKNQSIRWMVKAKVSNQILRRLVHNSSVLSLFCSGRIVGNSSITMWKSEFMIYTYSRSVRRIARYLSNTFFSLSIPSAERIELPRKVWANIFHPWNRTNLGSCLRAIGKW